MQKTEKPPIAACCADQANRLVVERRPDADGKGDLTVERCTVCDRKHYTLEVSGAVFGAVVQALK